jgi:hypothetical protein
MWLCFSLNYVLFQSELCVSLSDWNVPHSFSLIYVLLKSELCVFLAWIMLHFLSDVTLFQSKLCVCFSLNYVSAPSELCDFVSVLFTYLLPPELCDFVSAWSTYFFPPELRDVSFELCDCVLAWNIHNSELLVSAPLWTLNTLCLCSREELQHHDHREHVSPSNSDLQ